MRFFTHASFFALAFMLASAAHAAPVTIVTGPKTGTYVAIGRDIARIGKAAGVEVEVAESEGSIDNIKRLNAGQASLGIVQSDVLGFLTRSKNGNSQKMAAGLRIVLPLYREEVHVLARGEIKSFAELKDKRVVVGEDGSGQMLTAINLLALLDVTPAQILKEAQPQGIVSLLENRADAMIYVGGKPVKLFKNLEEVPAGGGEKYAATARNLHFLAVDDPRALEEYAPASIGAEDYGFVKQPVPTIAVSAVLVDNDYSGKSKGKAAAERCRRIYELVKGLREHIGGLRQNGHPKWKEVALDAELPGWKKDACAWEAKASPRIVESKKSTRSKGKSKPKTKSAPAAQKHNGAIPNR